MDDHDSSIETASRTHVLDTLLRKVAGRGARVLCRRSQGGVGAAVAWKVALVLKAMNRLPALAPPESIAALRSRDRED